MQFDQILGEKNEYLLRKSTIKLRLKEMQGAESGSSRKPCFAMYQASVWPTELPTYITGCIPGIPLAVFQMYPKHCSRGNPQNEKQIGERFYSNMDVPMDIIQSNGYLLNIQFLFLVKL